jgi:hypothetical protein
MAQELSRVIRSDVALLAQTSQVPKGLPTRVIEIKPAPHWGGGVAQGVVSLIKRNPKLRKAIVAEAIT